MKPGKKIYFLSDFHLGIPDDSASRDRERRIMQLLESIREEAEAIFLLGDTFDFWFEWKHVVPRGHVRLLGTLAALTDAGIPIHVFTGNHDLWMFGYFQEELGIPVYHHPQRFSFGDKRFFVGHGDGLGPGDKGFKRLKKLFTHPWAQWAFARLHPNLAMRIALYWSRHSRLIDGGAIPEYLGEEREWLVQFCKSQLEQEAVDYFIFGHRHLPLYLPVGPQSWYINTGDWLQYDSYAVFDGHTVALRYYNAELGTSTDHPPAG